jgi:hypothetical protein
MFIQLCPKSIVIHPIRRHSFPKIHKQKSTSEEIARIGLQRALDSLQRAEEEFTAWRTVNPQDFTSAGYLALNERERSCRTVVSEATQLLQSFSASNGGNFVG